MPIKKSDASGTSLTTINGGTLTVSFRGIIKMSLVEQELSRAYSQTLKADKTSFDLSYISSIGYWPAVLIFNWAATLKEKKDRKVELKLPRYSELNNQTRRILLGQGIVQQLDKIGVEVPHGYTPLHRQGQPLTRISSIDNLWSSLQETAERIITLQKLTTTTGRILRDAFQTILYELIENAYIHTEAAFPHYGVSLANTGEPTSSFYGLTEPGANYLEVYVGDLGPGIQARLESSMSEDYVPPFRSTHEFLKPEKVLAYALEFSTTSDVEGRKKRLRKLLKSQEDIESTQIATGLYYVTELTRSLAGQLLIRTPKAFLNLKFNPNHYDPDIKGRKEFGMGSLGAIPGTHYLVQLPLVLKTVNRPVVTNTRSSPKPIPIRVLDSFGDMSHSQPIEAALYSAITKTDEYLMRNRASEQIVLIPQPRFQLPSRAEALFIRATQSMMHGQCRVLWANRHARFTIKQPSSIDSQEISFAGQAMLVGDLLSNSFSAIGHEDPRWEPLLGASDQQGNTLSLQDSLILNVRDKYRKHEEQLLKLILNSHGIKHTGESFLIEGQYYTETFFEIDRIWDEPDNIRLFAEWALTKIDPKIDVLIAHSAPVHPLVDALAALIKEYVGIDPIVVEHELNQSPAKTISRLVSLAGHSAVIITDVICTGDRINEFLSLATNIEIKNIITLVDGRSDESENPIYWALSKNKQLLRVDAVHNEKIAVYKDPPKRGRSTDDTNTAHAERVYVIDRDTRAPALYVRPAKPQLTVEEVLKGPAKRSKALLCGHIEHNDRHHLYFLHFPKLFSSLQEEIKTWVNSQINYVRQSARARNQQWYGYIYNPDESLSWMTEFLTTLVPKTALRVLSSEHLKAPLPPREGDPEGNWVIILPALASGETARLCIEYVSRHNPATILLLCIASRMDPYTLTFYTNISRYGDADLRTASFLEFPVPAFESKWVCPQCAELAKLRELRIATTNDMSSLAESLTRKIAANKAIPSGGDLQDDWLAREPSEEDFQRAYLRALYEVSFVDIEIRRELNALLTEESYTVDRFIEVISRERFNKLFSRDELNIILYKADANVRNRLLQIINDAKPPLIIGDYIGAIIHLLPHVFIAKAVDMLIRFSTSQSDVEEICIGLLQVGIEPSDEGDLFELFRQQPTAVLPTLFRDTLDVIRRTQDKDRHNFDLSIKAVGHLWAQFARSSLFSEALDRLAQTPLDRYPSWQEIKSLTSQLRREWKQGILELISKIESGPLWPRIKSRRSNISVAVTRLEGSIAKLDLLSAKEEQTLFISDNLVVEIRMTAKEVERACKEIARDIYSFFINPVMCSAAELGDVLITNDGSELKVIKVIDQRVPKVFFDLEDLEAVCGQLIGNWKKHKKKPKRGSKVWFKIFSSDADVVLEFGDDIEGGFDLKSRGGLAVVRESCQSYGGIVKAEISPREKVLRVHLRALDPKLFGSSLSS
ncbi:MAG: hypothetical protein QOE33_1590 [Acidobacteriota bacterium]|nr:hypothetical protein [Acidobacteriota bacterium]